jgi:hypothetical protein
LLEVAVIGVDWLRLKGGHGLIPVAGFSIASIPVYAPKSNASELRIGDAGYFTAIDLIFISMCQFQVTFFPIVASQGAPTNN